MMIKGLGIDLVEIERIKNIVDKWGEHFLNKIFTSAEIEYCQGKSASYQHFAARFAAKEAAVKMLGKTRGVGWKDIEVKRNVSGRPYLLLKNKAKLIADQMGIDKLHITISHERKMTVAQVIGEGD